MRTITVVGAGFAGLTLAHELVKLGFQVSVHEKQDRPGGMLSTAANAYGLVESAANALLADRDIENLFHELDVPLAGRLASRKKRYIFWDGKARRWPLPLGVTARLLVRAARLALDGQSEFLPAGGESIANWGRRFGGAEFEERVLTPALQGIYAGDPERLSAVLLLRSFLGERTPRAGLKGSIAPEGGMGALMTALTESLGLRGVQFEYESTYTLPEYIISPTVVCTSAWAAADIFKASKPALAAQLAACESIALVSATCFFEPADEDLQGFGCLFPKSQGFHSLGVLFNDCIFEGRSEVRSETWILGGAGFDDVVALSEEQIVQRILEDRDRMGSECIRPLRVAINSWPRAIPHYTVEWERTLRQLKVEAPMYLHGNYLGGLGLSKIYAASRALAQRIHKEYGA